MSARYFCDICKGEAIPNHKGGLARIVSRRPLEGGPHQPFSVHVSVFKRDANSQDVRFDVCDTCLTSLATEALTRSRKDS